MKLKTKILIILAAILFASLGGGGHFFLNYYEKAFRQAALHRVDAAARANANYLSDYLKIQRSLAHHIRHYFPEKSFLEGDIEQVDSFLEEHYLDLPYFDNGFFLLDRNGVLIADYPPTQDLRGKNFSFREYFKKTMEERRDIIARPYRSERTGRKVLTFSIYLESSNGEPLGLVALSADLIKDARLAKLRLEKHGDRGYNYVFDSSRLMILHPDEKRMLTRDVKPGVNTMFDAALKGFTGAAETVNSKGVPMLAAFYPVQGSDWIVASQQPVEDALSAFIYARRNLQYFIFSVIFVAVALGVVLVQRSMRHLNLLEKVTENLHTPQDSSGFADFNVEDEAEKLKVLMSHKEFGPLAQKIGQLYSSLGGSLAATQKKTDDLNAAYKQLKRSQAQILQQEKMASVGQLAAGVAHEINNPMGFISSNLNTLQRYFEKLVTYQAQLEEWLRQADSIDKNDDFSAFRKKLKVDFILEDIPELIEESNSGAERVREIVQNLKSFSRVDQEAFCQADINQCLENTIAIAWNELKYKASLERDFGELPLVDCYPQQLNQVFLNILVNAAQAIEEQGVINVKTRSEEGAVRIEISDTGCGIPKELQEKIFEPFFTTKDVGEGTGLGMSISYEIIKAHQGEIRVTSEEGEGTTFIILLPANKEKRHDV